MTGENGAGKTNLLEALHVGSQGFSPRARADAQLVRFGAEAARVTLVGTERASQVETAVTLSPGEPKRVRLNGVALASADDLRARLSALVFLPDRLALVKGSPIVRRAYFDRMLGRLFPALATLPSEYARVLAQRNEALRRTRAGISSADAIAPWSERVALLGSELERARAALVAALAPRFGERARALGLGGADLRYDARPFGATELEARLERDLARGVTSLGPHLRDIAISARARELRTFGSQGEQRSAVLGLVLAEADLASERRRTPPLLLLDDVLSELDQRRRAALLSLLPAEGQSVITATTREALSGGGAEPTLVVRVTPGEARRA